MKDAEAVPLVSPETAEALCRALGSFEPPPLVGDATPTEDFIEGFEEARATALEIVRRAGGLDG